MITIAENAVSKNFEKIFSLFIWRKPKITGTKQHKGVHFKQEDEAVHNYNQKPKQNNT